MQRLFRIKKHLLPTFTSKAFSTSVDALQFERENPYVTEIKFNQPKKLNSVDIPTIDQIISELKSWEKTQKFPKAVVMSGNGGKAFCAGGDIKSLYTAKTSGNNLNILQDFFSREYLADYSLAKMKPLQIAVWNGIVMGGGIGLSIHAPIRIATEKSVFAMPEAAIGLLTDVSGSYFLSRIGGSTDNLPLGMFLGLVGHKLSAKEIYNWGLATHFMKIETAEKMVKELKSVINNNTPREEIIGIVEKYNEGGDKDAISHEKEIRECFREDDGLLGIKNRLQKLSNGEISGDKEFAAKILKDIQAYSPISMHVIYEQIRRGKNMTLEEAFLMEYKLTQSFMEGKDFFEGVRALLVDKDKQPKWSHKSIDDVDPSYINKLFDRQETLNLDLLKDK